MMSRTASRRIWDYSVGGILEVDLCGSEISPQCSFA